MSVSGWLNKWMGRKHALEFIKAIYKPSVAEVNNLPELSSAFEFSEIHAIKTMTRPEKIFERTNAKNMLVSLVDLAFKRKDSIRANVPRIVGTISLLEDLDVNYTMEDIVGGWIYKNYKTNLLSNHVVDVKMDGRKFLKAYNQFGTKSWTWKGGWDNYGREAIVHSWIFENKKLLDKSFLVGKSFPQGKYYGEELQKYTEKQRRP